MNKKELKRSYKETPRPMGIYRIHNIANDRSLIGHSVDVPSVLNRERAQLRLGAHPNRLLQSDWDALGPESFSFEVLDTLTPPERQDYDPSDDLRVLETLWLERLEPFEERGYTPRPRVRK